MVHARFARTALGAAVSSTFLTTVCAAGVISPTFTYVIGSEMPIDGFHPTGQDSPAYNAGVLGFPVYYENIQTHILLAVTPEGDWNFIATGLAPGGSGAYSGLSFSPDMHGQDAAYHAFTEIGVRAVCARVNGQSWLVADRRTTLPGGMVPSAFGTHPSIDAGTVAFSAGSNSAPRGMFTWNAGVIQRVVGLGDAVPGRPGSTFTSLRDSPVIGQGRVAFIGGTTMGATIHTTNVDGSEPTLVASRDTPIPGRPVNFSGFSELAFDRGAVAFHGGGSSFDGIYTNAGGTMRMVADTLTLIPGGTGFFTFSDAEPAISNGNVAFVGLGADGQRGIYGDFGAGLEKVIAVQDVLDGRVVANLLFGREGLDGNTLAFYVRFTDNSDAVYITAVPAPASGAVLVIAAPVCARWRRRPSPM